MSDWKYIGDTSTEKRQNSQGYGLGTCTYGSARFRIIVRALGSRRRIQGLVAFKQGHTINPGCYSTSIIAQRSALIAFWNNICDVIVSEKRLGA